MRKISIFIVIAVFGLLLFACGGSNKKQKEENNENNEKVEKIEKKKEVKTKTPTQLLMGGTWTNYNAIHQDFIEFKANGVLEYVQGRDSGKDKWKLKGENILVVFKTDYKIVELSETKLIIEDKVGKTTYSRSASGNATNTNESVDEIVINKETSTSECFITEIIHKNGNTYIKVDYVDRKELEGEGAYEIVNNNPKIRTFIAKKESYKICSRDGTKTIKDFEITLKKEPKTLFSIEVKDGEIEEFYIDTCSG